MRYARSHQYIQAGAGPEDNRQLFFACAPTSATEEQLQELFSRYGEVRSTLHTGDARGSSCWHIAATTCGVAAPHGSCLPAGGW